MTATWLITSALMTVRVIAITFGTYALVDGVSALAGLALHAFGIPLSDAMLTTVLVGYLLYVTIIMWAFVERRTWQRPLIIVSSAIVSKIFAAYLAVKVLA